MKAKCFSGASSVRDQTAEVLKTLARRAALALLAIVATALAAQAQGTDAFPARPITLVVPFAPSGGNDIMARLVGERMGKALAAARGAAGIAPERFRVLQPGEVWTL